MKEILAGKIKGVLMSLQQDGTLAVFDIPDVNIDRPKNEAFGDYTTNIALIIAKAAKKAPMEIAELIAEKMDLEGRATAEAEQPGYVNVTLSQPELTEALERVIKEKSHYGDGYAREPKKINNEFVSANPTGPFHIGNGRGGFYGDALARLLRKGGHHVTNEYYVNDAGEQITKLGHSVLKDAEAVYVGEYIDELRLKIPGTDPKVVGRQAAALIMDEYIKPTLTRMGIVYNVFTSEQALVEAGLVERAIEKFKIAGATYEEEGALWLRTSDFDDDKDRVLIKKDGTKTYFASECGHILTYLEQSVDTIIETFGADHHGYVKRFEAAARFLGFSGELHFILTQLVRLKKGEEEVRMSKREGNIVSMDELLDAVGEDVARFFFLMYSPDTHMTFDLELATERSEKNPVYYVQYAHARLTSILEKGQEAGLEGGADLALLTHPKELELLREIYLTPEHVAEAAALLAPHRLAQRSIKLAEKFHSFYAECQVVDTEERVLSLARLQLVAGVKETLAGLLELIGVSAPERM